MERTGKKEPRTQQIGERKTNWWLHQALVEKLTTLEQIALIVEMAIDGQRQFLWGISWPPSMATRESAHSRDKNRTKFVWAAKPSYSVSEQCQTNASELLAPSKDSLIDFMAAAPTTKMQMMSLKPPVHCVNYRCSCNLMDTTHMSMLLQGLRFSGAYSLRPL